MSELIIILTAFACIGLAGFIFYGIFLKEKERLDEENEVDDYRDEELNSIYDDYGRNDYN